MVQSMVTGTLVFDSSDVFLGSVHIWAISFKPQPYVFLIIFKTEEYPTPNTIPSTGKECWGIVVVLEGC